MPSTGVRGRGPVSPMNMTGRKFADQQRALEAKKRRERELAERDAAEADTYLSSLTRGGELTPVFDPQTQEVLYFVDRYGNEVSPDE